MPWRRVRPETCYKLSSDVDHIDSPQFQTLQKGAINWMYTKTDTLIMQAIHKNLVWYVSFVWFGSSNNQNSLFWAPSLWIFHQMTTYTVAFVALTAVLCQTRRVADGRSMEIGALIIGTGSTFAEVVQGHCAGCLLSMKMIWIVSRIIGFGKSTCSSYTLKFPNLEPSETNVQTFCNHCYGCHSFFCIRSNSWIQSKSRKYSK